MLKYININQNKTNILCNSTILNVFEYINICETILKYQRAEKIVI